MIRYSENSEYNYLSWLVYCEREAEEERIVEPIRERYWQAYCSGDRPLAEALWEEANQLRMAIVERMRRREDIVHWLHLDMLLRQEGKTYPDTYETAGWARRKNDDEF